MTGHRLSCEIFCSESEYSIRLEKYIVNHKIYDFVFKAGVVQATPATLQRRSLSIIW